MKINIFNDEHDYFPLRWIIVLGVVLTATIFYYDYYSERIFSSSNQQQWSRSGPGYHK